MVGIEARYGSKLQIHDLPASSWLFYSPCRGAQGMAHARARPRSGMDDRGAVSHHAHCRAPVLSRPVPLHERLQAPPFRPRPARVERTGSWLRVESWVARPVPGVVSGVAPDTSAPRAKGSGATPKPTRGT